MSNSLISNKAGAGAKILLLFWSGVNAVRTVDQLELTPGFLELAKTYPSANLDAGGSAVGLRAAETASASQLCQVIGSGRGLDKGYAAVLDFLNKKKFGSEISGFFDRLRAMDGYLHILMPLTERSGFDNQDFCAPLQKYLHAQGLSKIAWHLFAGGENNLPKSCLGQLRRFIAWQEKQHGGELRSLSGAFYGLDETSHYARSRKAWQAIVSPAPAGAPSALEAVRENYEKNIFDDDLPPLSLAGAKGLSDRDAVLFFDLDPSRFRQLAEIFIPARKPGQTLPDSPADWLATFVSRPDFVKIPAVFSPSRPALTLAESLAKNRVRQLRIAPASSFPLLAYFFNGRRSSPAAGEDWQALDLTLRTAAGDDWLDTALSEFSQELKKALARDYHFIAADFFSADLAGLSARPHFFDHFLKSADRTVSDLAKAAAGAGWTVMIMPLDPAAENIFPASRQEAGAAKSNRLPLVVLKDDFQTLNFGWPEPPNNDWRLAAPIGTIRDLAPTILELLKIKKPASMLGSVLFTNHSA